MVAAMRPFLIQSSRSEEHTSELQSLRHLVCRLLLEKKKKKPTHTTTHINNSAVTRECRKSGDSREGLVGVLASCSGLDFPCCIFPPVFFFFNDTAPPEIYPLSLHDALPI